MACNRSAAVPNNARIVWKGGASEVEMGCTEHMVELVQGGCSDTWRGGAVPSRSDENKIEKHNNSFNLSQARNSPHGFDSINHHHPFPVVVWGRGLMKL